jgi:hypothetical protein
MKDLRNPIALLVLILVVAAFSAPFGTPQLAAFAKDFLPAVATLVAAYAGSWYAFSLNQSAVERELKAKQISAGSKAMFVLWRQINTIAQVQEDVINKYRDFAPAPLAMPTITIFFQESVRLNIEEISFLTDHSKPELLANLYLAETRYMHIVDLIRQRNDLHANEILPKIEGKKPLHRNLTPEELREIIGVRLFHQLFALTTAVISGTDDAVVTLDKVANELNAALKSIFPGHRFIRSVKMEVDEKGESMPPRSDGLL